MEELQYIPKFSLWLLAKREEMLIEQHTHVGKGYID